MQDNTKTLLVIDVQTGYDGPDFDKKIPAIVNLTKFAKKNNWNIIVLNYVGAGSLDHRVSDVVDNYKKLHRLYKYDCDGGNVVTKYLKVHRMSRKDIVVCGLYADDCVFKTVRTMAETLLDKTTITVVKKATIAAYKFPTYPVGVKVTP